MKIKRVLVLSLFLIFTVGSLASPALLDKTIIDTGWNVAGMVISIMATGTGGTIGVVDAAGTNTTCKNPKPRRHGIG